MKILAVDDDPYIRELLLLIFSRSGYGDITVAPSGDAALEAIEVADPAFDCLFFDIQMPGMDGIDLCTRVRQIDGYEKTPIIMLTAMTERDFIDRAFAAGATDYVTKPFDTLELGVRARNAEELIKARRAALGGPETERGLLLLEGIKDLVDHQVLRNYLTQLSRAGSYGTQLVAIKIDNIAGIRTKGSVAELRYALTDVAEAISGTLSPFGLLMAEAGIGVFVCVSNNPNLFEPMEIEAAIQTILDDRDAVFDDGSPMDIDVSVGAPIRPNSSEARDVDQVIDRAIARAENRIQEKAKPAIRLHIRRDIGRR